MRISVVIPTYNSGVLLQEALFSVLAQTRTPAEIIVVDDGSTDDTAERVAAFGSAVRYLRKENGGVSSARNFGSAAAKGDLIAFLDADDVWHPRKLEIQVATLGRRPDLGLVATFMYPWPGDVPEVPGNVVPEMQNFRLNDLLVCNSLTTSTIVVWAELLRKAGPFDVTLHGPEDWDMWIRLARLTSIAKLRLRLAGYRNTPGSLSKNAAQMEKGESAILQKIEAAGLFRRKPLLRRKAWAYFRFSCGRDYLQAGNRWAAAWHLGRSLLGYPLPYSRQEIRRPFERIKLLAAAILKPPPRPTGGD